MANIKLGEILVKQGLVRPDQMAKALDEQKRTNSRLSQILISQGILKDNQILKAMEKAFSLPGVDLNTFEIQAEVTRLVPREVCEKHGLIPIQKVGTGTVVIAFSDPSNLQVRDDLRFITKAKVQPVVATEIAISAAIDRHYSATMNEISKQVEREQAIEDAGVATAGEGIDFGTGGEEENPIVKFVNAVLTDAIRKKASDIHFEPYEKRFRVRLRTDGVMVEANSQSNSSAAAISSRIKIMSKLDIAEKRRPQDGRIKLRLSKSGREMDFRVSVLPTIWGEKVVLRLLDKSNLQLDMTKLGMEPEDLALFKEVIQQPQGLVLITGPTGSGKTTTIYSALAELNQPDVNISTAEDPVEFNFDGINQVQMNPDIDLTFASALRSFLRQDPDIIMVGEIRDLETAEISMKAASTGHLVVSTLHTNDAPQTVARLTEMGVAPYIVTSTVSLIVAQRLVGTICQNCKTPVQVDEKTLLNIGVDPADLKDFHVYKGKGCSTCNGTGIKGRQAIFEVMRMTEPIKEAVLRGASQAELRSIARSEGMRTLRRSAILKLKRGITTIEEVLNASVRDTDE
ncbi:MAG: type IV-A pilus assembly ATPase PilB [Pseudobdellovibrionaceae bacterium]